MKAIFRDFHKRNRGNIISTIAEVVLFPILIILNIDMWQEGFWGKFFIIALSAMVIIQIYMLIVCFVIMPRIMTKQVNAMTESERTAIFTQYPTAKDIDGHKLAEDIFVCFNTYMMIIASYNEVLAVEKYGKKLKLTIKDRQKPITVPFSQYGLNGVVAAYIKSKNPEVKFITNAN